MTTMQARHISNMPWGGVANQGQVVLFRLSFHDGSEEVYGCDLSLLPLLLGNLTQYGRMADAVRVKMPPDTLMSAAPYRVTEVARSGHSDDGRIVSVEFATDHGFPVSVAMTPDQARQTIEYLKMEILLAADVPTKHRKN